ncbi:MAG: T9SS type A sorting domain-containing protein [Bacteroidales bacterium]
MKKILSFLVLSFFALSMNAQNAFVNGGFETWSSGSNTLPTDWKTLSLLGSNLSNISKSTDSHSGSLAVKIAGKKLMIQIPGISAAPGFLTNGDVDVMGLAQLDFSSPDIMNQLPNIITNGTPLNRKPTTISGYYNWNPINGMSEQFLLISLVVSNTSGTREVIGTGIFTQTDILGTTKETYTEFNSEIIYMNPNATPTEFIFLALTMNLDSTSTTFGSLLLDDLSMTTVIGLEKINNDTKTPLVIYPNPTTGEFRLNVKSKVEVSVYNQLGQVVVSPMDYTPNTKVYVKEKGIYFVRIKDANSTKTQKLIVK